MRPDPVFDAVMTVDAHAMEQLGDTDAEDAAPHKVFMQQVLYGCVRYKKPLRTFLLNFYDNAGKILRSTTRSSRCSATLPSSACASSGSSSSAAS